MSAAERVFFCVTVVLVIVLFTEPSLLPLSPPAPVDRWHLVSGTTYVADRLLFFFRSVCVCDKFGVFPASRVTQSITCGLQGQWAEEMRGY